MAKYGFIVVAPTPIKTAKVWVSNASELSTFIEQYPLKPKFTKWEWTAPTDKIDGMLALLEVIFLSDKIRVLLPSLTAISHSSLIFSILFLNEVSKSNVQSIILTFFWKKIFEFFKLRIA